MENDDTAIAVSNCSFTTRLKEETIKLKIRNLAKLEGFNMFETVLTSHLDFVLDDC